MTTSIAYQHLLGRFNEELFPDKEDINIGGRRSKCIRFPSDMALLAEDERMLKSMLMELSDTSEDYVMKINLNKAKAMVIITKPKKINIRIIDESVEQVDSFKYLGCNIRSSMNCCQDAKPRKLMTKEALNRTRSNFCGPLEKELRKRLVRCFV